MRASSDQSSPKRCASRWWWTIARARPANVPRAIIERLNKEIVSILENPEVQRMVLAEGGEIASGTPEDFAAFLRSELPKWAHIIKRAGITAD